MERYLCFSNDGILDIEGLILMGASTKRNDESKIGQYGTGWKYAIATLLRNNIEIQIFNGERNIPVTTRNITMRGQTFQMVVIGDVDTNFTTDLGPDWNLWMAIREIYCNSLDEPKNIVSIDYTPIDVQSNRTKISIGVTEEIQTIITNWADYFCFERQQDILFEIPDLLTVYRKPYRKNSIIYRRGVRVAVTDEPGCFDYDFNHIVINELREADLGDVKDKLKQYLTSRFNKEVIETILKSGDTWEKKIHFNSWDSIYNKEAWSGAIGRTTIIPSEYNEKFKVEIKQNEESEEVKFLQVPTVMAQIISTSMPEVTVLGFSGNRNTLAIPEDMDDAFGERISDCMRLLELSHMCAEGEFVVQASTFTTHYIRSSHKGNTIIIASSLKNADSDEIVYVLFREILQIRHESSKESSFEKYLIDTLMNYIIYTD